jgi:hypothetical protein
MRANVMARKSAGFSLAVVAVVGLSLMLLTIPSRVDAQGGHSTAQGTHPVTTGPFKTINGRPDSTDFGLPFPDTVQSTQRLTQPNWLDHQAYFNFQPCGFAAYSPFGDPFASDSIDSQSWGLPLPYGEFDGTMNGSDLLAWYAYNAQAGWWSASPYANLSPAYDWCPGFEGWWGP